VISYEFHGRGPRAVRGELDPESREVTYATALHRHVTNFARMFKAKELQRVPAEIFRVSVLKNLATFLQNPSADEVAHLAGMSYLSGFDNSQAAAQPVAMTVSTRDTFRLLVARAFRRRMRSADLQRRFDLAKRTWPEAARLLTPRWARAIKRGVPTPQSTKWWLRRMLLERSRGPLPLAARGLEYYKRTPRPDVTASVPPRTARNGQGRA
jgi:hypothetical protein